jgi:hypothetical protein
MRLGGVERMDSESHTVVAAIEHKPRCQPVSAAREAASLGEVVSE